MISTLEKEITFRFLKARKKDGFLNIISIFSFIGIGLGVAVLIIVMSVMNGFRSELINKIVGFNAHITVQPYQNEIVINDLNKTNLNLISNDLIMSNSGEAVIIQKDKVFNKSKFFPDSKLNYAENILKKKSNDIAINFLSEKGFEVHRGFHMVRGAGRIHFHHSWYLSDSLVPSYEHKKFTIRKQRFISI